MLRPIDVRGFNTNDDSIKDENKEVLRPIVPERPVRILPGPQNYGTNYGKISGNKTFPLDMSPKVDQRTRATLTNSSANKDEKAKMELVQSLRQMEGYVLLSQSQRPAHL